jgi:hypothetical protein
MIMDNVNRFIRTPDELDVIMQAFKIAPGNKIGEIIVSQTDKIIDLNRRIKYLEGVIETQKKQLELKQNRTCNNQGRKH